MPDPALLLIARIGRPHGLRGEVTVQVHTDDPDGRFVAGAAFVTEAGPGAGVPPLLTVSSHRRHRDTWLLGFEEVPDRTGAEALRGTRLLAPADDSAGAAEDDEDAWYESQLVGLVAVDPGGTRIGTVAGLTVGGAQDLLEIEIDGGARALVPFVHQLVPEVDVAGGRVVVAPPPGLLELGSP